MSANKASEPGRSDEKSPFERLLSYGGAIFGILGGLAGLVALATVPEVRAYLCYNQNYIFCPKLEIRESRMRVFGWYPQPGLLDAPGSTPSIYDDALAPQRELYDIPPIEGRFYASQFSSGTRKWLFWEAQLKSHEPPGRPVNFNVHWTLYDPEGNPFSWGATAETWGSNYPAAVIVGPADIDASRTVSQLPRGHYEIVSKISGDQLSDREVRCAFDVQ